MALEADKAIVTLADARLFLGKGSTDTVDDQLIDAVVQQASEMIAAELGVANVISSSYKEYRDGHGGPNIWLNNYPVSSVDLASVDRDDAITIEYTGLNASYATVEVTDTTLRLRKRVSGVLTTSTFTLADYATLSALETAIELVSGWTVTTQTTFATYPASALCRVPARNARDQEITLGVPDEGVTDYELTPQTGRLYCPGLWPVGHNNVYVEYTAGYARADVPQPIRSACLDLVGLLYNLSKKDLTLRSETIGDYSYSLNDKMEALVSGGIDTAQMGIIGMKLAKCRRDLIG